uniref:Uncharacterized protein n=1 Tax=Amphimedon queenslandica TaxID=400682 RepID=A0A1X7UAD8_AMPQE
DDNDSSSRDSEASTNSLKDKRKVAVARQKNSSSRLEKTLESVIDKFMGAQREMEERYIELEEKE